MIADHIRSIPKKLLEVVVDNKITVLQGTPSLIFSFGKKALKENLLSKESVLRVLAFGGEVCPSFSKLKLWKCDENCTEIYNLYGLTEVSCWASCFRIDFQNGKSLPSIPIGEPLLNTKLEIHDEKGEIADEGELYIGGSGRYCIVNNEQWPMNSDSVLRPTGDLVHKASNGFIYFEGRSDCVIKYKGHKISLQLINSIVDSFPEVENSFIHYDPSSAKLHIFIVLVSAGSLDSDVERKMVKRLRKSLFSLPPIIFSPVPFIPMTKHGKADREKLLSLLNVSNEQRASFRSAICNNCENVISDIWKSYTNQMSVMENDNFALHGGDSLTAVQFVSDIEWHFQLSFPLLIEKILNETFKDVTQYANLCLKGHSRCTLLYENDSQVVQSLEQPPPKKMCFDVKKCFKFACKGGYFEYCCHSNNSANCLHQTSEASEGDTLHLSLVSKWDLKKCVDATPCILYVPQFNQHLIFIGSHFGVFSCINVEERLEKWQITVPDRIESSACISSCGNYVLFGCYDHHLYCINIADGRVSWKYETGAEVKSSPSVSVNNKVFVGSHDKCVYAINAKSGHLLWKKQISFGSIFSSPLTIDRQSTVCVGTLDGVLALLNMESGDILWKYCSGKPLFSSPVIISNYILVGSTDKCILCLDFEGKEVFKYLTDGPVFSSAAFSNSSEENLVLFGCHDFYVYCLTLSGDLLWKTLCDSAIYATPVIFMLNNCFYVCVTSSKGTIYIFERSNGKVVLSWNCPGEIFSSPVVLDNVLVVGCRDNNVYCFMLEV